MAWLETEEIRQKFNIVANRFNTQIVAASRSAALIIQRGVDSEVYTEAIDDTPPTDPTDLARFESVVEAHSFLTMWFLVGNVGNRLGEQGFVKQAQDTGSPAMQGGILTNQYLTPKELESLRKSYLDNAQLWIGPYGTIDVTLEETVVETGLGVSSLKWF